MASWLALRGNHHDHFVWEVGWLVGGKGLGGETAERTAKESLCPRG